MSNQLIQKLHSVLVSLVRHWLNTAPGTFFLVRFAFNLTLLGSTSSNHTLHDTRPILHIASIWFQNIINLNLTGLSVIKSYELEHPFSVSALKFANIFNLRVSQIAVHSTCCGIEIKIDTVFGNSVIEQSSFKYGFTQISIFLHCPIDKSVCTIIQSLHAHLSYHHKISIQDCIFESGSTSMHATLNSFPVQIDILIKCCHTWKTADITYHVE